MKVKREGIEIRHFSKHYTGAIFLFHILSICDNDDGDEGDEEHVNMAMALLQKLLDGVNIYLTFFNDNLAQDPGLQDTKNRYVLKKKSRQILLREVFKSNFENFLGRICLEIFFFSAYLFFGTLPTSQKKRL